MTADNGDLVERSRKMAADAVDFHGETMKEWDKIRAMCAEPDGSDLPRLTFEGLIKGFADLLDKQSDEIELLRSQLAISQELCTKFEAAVGEDVAEMLDLRTQLASAKEVIGWVEIWVSNPVSSYSVYALDRLFGMTRDKIAKTVERLM